ncbi:hypothetical protein LMH87_007463 [Akanthomyces muscarius]|uniref:Uncharacterized protein n=1 Tax=Akanthomyces muscarius TaxID=2231603 RepID=A0A9W8USG0_AKAMU|nr:hypothetical protein LMH87_007463 [Akanthomyces muscarius]KAJ4165851.1 hypothetical protein LMH87_007463 [Akanthomyces muscarius]
MLNSDVSHKRQQCHFMVPFGRNKEFVGRDSIFERLLATIAPSADQDDCQRVALEGLGGVGKTQIALEAVFRLRNDHPDCSVFWVPALDAASFESAYRDIGRQLRIKGIEKDDADVGSLVKTALSESAFSWLLIIDNVDDAQLFFGDSNATPLGDYLPFSRNGSIVVTTRNHQVVTELDISTSNTFLVGEMSRDESIKMLRQSIKETRPSDGKDASELLDFLADLPLAIKQASSYIAKTGISISRYSEHCRSSDKKLIKLLSKGFEDRSRYKNSVNPVATTWWISFKQIARESRNAAEYLTFMCFFAEKEIPKALLPPGMDEDDDEMERDEAIGILKAYSFILERPESNSFDMHRLVRLALRNWLQVEQKLRHCSTAVAQWLAVVFPSLAHENRDIWLKYLPHIQSALDFSDAVDANEVKGGLLSKMAICFNLLGKYNSAEVSYRASLQLRNEVLGIEHPRTLGNLNGLANVLQCQGRYWEAEHTHRQTLELRQRVLGREHADTLASMSNLALSLVGGGKWQEAEQLHRQTLESRKTVLGEEHPETLASMNNLALLLDSRERCEEAGEIYQKTVPLMEKVLGKEHPNTLISRNNLGNVLQRQGRHSESEDMHRETLQLRQKVLGEEHPDTLASMNNLALLLVSLEMYEEGEKLHQQTLKLRQTVLGKEHPDTFASMKNLASATQCLSQPPSKSPERSDTRARRSYGFLPSEPSAFALGYPSTMSGSCALPQSESPEPSAFALGYPSTMSGSCALPQSESREAYDSEKLPSSANDTSHDQPAAQPLPDSYQPAPPPPYESHLRTFSGDDIQRHSSTRSLPDSFVSKATPPPIPRYQPGRQDMFETMPSAPQHFGPCSPGGYTFKYSDCTGRRKALLIGINYFGQRGQLRGCINDVRNMTSYLAEELACRREDMIILTDDQQSPTSQPTKQNILRAMQWLVRDADPNDSLFFHYSGHGGQTKDLDGDEPDGYDEVIYPVDFRQNGHISDDEMHDTMVRPLCAGVRLTAIFDSCHSGTALDLPYIYSTQGILKEPNLAKEAGHGLLGVISSYSQGDLGGMGSQIMSLFKKATSGEEAHSRAIATKTSPADVIMFSGSKDDQTSADASIGLQATGAMSWALITSLKKNPRQSYVQLLNSIRDELSTRYTQKPQISCSHPLNTNLLFVM